MLDLPYRRGGHVMGRPVRVLQLTDMGSRSDMMSGDGRMMQRSRRVTYRGGRGVTVMWVADVPGRPDVSLQDVLVQRDARVADGSVHGVEERRVLAREVVPPVAHEVLLVEHRAVGTEERVLAAVAVADVEHLRHKMCQNR